MLIFERPLIIARVRYSKLTLFLDALIFEKNQEMLIFDHCLLFKKTIFLLLRGLNYRTRAKISRAYLKLTRFLDALIFEPCLFSRDDYSKYPWIFRHYFSKYILYFGWFQCIQIFLCLNYTFWVYCYALISTFIPKKYVIYVSTAIFIAEEI